MSSLPFSFLIFVEHHSAISADIPLPPKSLLAFCSAPPFPLREVGAPEPPAELPFDAAVEEEDVDVTAAAGAAGAGVPPDAPDFPGAVAGDGAGAAAGAELAAAADAVCTIPGQVGGALVPIFAAHELGAARGVSSVAAC